MAHARTLPKYLYGKVYSLGHYSISPPQHGVWQLWPSKWYAYCHLDSSLLTGRVQCDIKNCRSPLHFMRFFIWGVKLTTPLPSSNVDNWFAKYRFHGHSRLLVYVPSADELDESMSIILHMITTSHWLPWHNYPSMPYFAGLVLALIPVVMGWLL